jgi:predicted rRNA methylase YqxC with S4 and FtsJ domains
METVALVGDGNATIDLRKLLVEAGMVKSKSEASRLIRAGALKVQRGGKWVKILTPFAVIDGVV